MRRTIVRRLETPLPRSTPASLFAGQGVLPIVALLAGAPRSLTARLVERWARAPMRSVDYVDGAAGALIAWSDIDSIAPELVDRARVRRLHAAVRRGLRVTDGAQLGLAHGIAGLLLAAEIAAARFDLELPTRERQASLDRLAASAVELPGEPALVWPARASDRRIVAHAWCHGAPGIALALAHAWRVTSQPAYRELAELALAGTARRIHRREPMIFCCGLAGRIQVLIEGYRVFGAATWLARARELARGLRAPPPRTRFRRSVLRGEPGIAYARRRLRTPERLPLFGVGLSGIPDTAGVQQSPRSLYRHLG